MGVRAVGLMVLSTLKAGLLSGHWPLGHRYILLSFPPFFSSFFPPSPFASLFLINLVSFVEMNTKAL